MYLEDSTPINHALNEFKDIGLFQKDITCKGTKCNNYTITSTVSQNGLEWFFSYGNKYLFRHRNWFDTYLRDQKTFLNKNLFK